MAKLTRRERLDNDVSQLFGYMERLDGEYDWQAEVAFGIAQLAYEEAYRTGDDTDAVAFTEEVAGPVAAHAHADAPEPAFDTDYWADRFADTPGTMKPPRISPKSDRMQELYDTVSTEFDTDAFDYVVGVFSAGMAPAYVVNEYFEDADPVMVRYSERKRDDTEVTMGPAMADRAAFEDERVLVVDDSVDRGGTAYNVCDAIAADDPAELQFVAANVEPNPVGSDLYIWRNFQDAYEPRSWDEIQQYIRSDAYTAALEEYARSKNHAVSVPEMHPLQRQEIPSND